MGGGDIGLDSKGLLELPWQEMCIVLSAPQVVPKFPAAPVQGPNQP